MDPVPNLEFDDYHLDTKQRLLLRRGVPILLSPKAFDTLLCLVRHPGAVLTKEELLAQVWPGTFVEENNLSQSISLLRKTFGDDRRTQSFIQTVPRRGYRFSCAVRTVEATTGNTTGPIALVTASTPSPAFNPADVPYPLTLSTATAPAATPARHSVRKPRTLPLSAVAAGLILTAGVAFWAGSASKPVPVFASAGSPASLVVLPCHATIANADAASTGLAFADDTVHALKSASPWMKVRPTSAIYRYAGQTPDPVTAARELNTTFALATDLSESSNRAQLKARLIRASDGHVVWQQQFDGSSTALFALEEKMSAALRGRFADAGPGAANHLTTDLGAYDDFMRARIALDRRTSEGIHQATIALESATRTDPHFAEAAALLAEAYAFDLQYWPRAGDLARHALTLRRNLPEAEAVLGFVELMWHGNTQAADQHFKSAIAADPASALAHQWYADSLAMQERIPEATEEMSQALALDPDSIPINNDLAHIYYLSGRFALAQAQARRTLQLAPEFLLAHVLLHDVYIQQHDYDHAIAEYKNVEQLAPSSGLYPESEAPRLDRAYANGGIRAFWQERVHYLQTAFVDDYAAARYLALLGRDREALQLLQKAAAPGHNNVHLLYIASDPVFQKLHTYPDFARFTTN